jgi:DNA-binding transcriptional ArsR family regulator
VARVAQDLDVDMGMCPRVRLAARSASPMGPSLPAAVLDAVSQPTRLRLFYLLDQIGEVCVCDLGEILGITQSAASQLLAKFKAYGLVTARRENQTLFYRLADKREVKMLRKAALPGIQTE